MKEILAREWFLETKFGKIGIISRGNPRKPGVLFVHGYMDSAATFLPLISLLPETHYYVSFDFPGHGKSDHISTMLLFPQAFLPQVMREIVDHLGWKSFVTVAHSIGFLITILYNHAYPGRVKKMINFDPLFPLAYQYMMIEKTSSFFQWNYDEYFDALRLNKTMKPRSYEEHVQIAMKDRCLSREQAEVVLSRSLVPFGEGLYKPSIQLIMKRMPVVPVYTESLSYILSHKIPPTLNFHGSCSDLVPEGRDFGLKLLEFQKPHQKDVFVDAVHDLHITHAEEMVPHIVDFLKPDFEAKL